MGNGSEMTSHVRSSDLLSAEEVRAELGLILASPAFSHSPRLAAFLRFVVESRLTGKADYIKSYTIGVEALGRSEGFDPHIDPIVRVEAGRLRKALARYYSGIGADRSVLIDLPRGSYVPVFCRQRTRRGAGLATLLSRHLSGRVAAWTMIACVAALVAVGIVVATEAWVTAGQPRSVPPPAAGFVEQGTTGVATPGRGRAVVVVQQFDSVGAGAELTAGLEDLRRKLRDAFARFEGIDVLSEMGSPAIASAPAATRLPGRSEYRISASLESQSDGAASLTFQLHDAVAGTIIWARRFEDVRIANDRAAVESMVRRVVATLAQPYGVIFARELDKVAAGEGDIRHQCVVRAIELRRRDDPAARQRVRACLNQVTTSDPTHAGAFAALALLAVSEYYVDDDGDRALIDRALKAALRAADLRPESARAHQALMSALFARGEIAAALAEGEKAVALNPYDMTVLGAYGMHLVMSGELEKGKALLQQAVAETQMRTPAFGFALFLCAYLQGDDISASYHASLLTSESYPLDLVARALDAWREGDRDRARQALDKLAALHPAWRSDPRGRLQRFIPSSAIVDRLVPDLAAAGLTN
jgi:tetratricopeptide (TPR) repeat protein